MQAVRLKFFADQRDQSRLSINFPTITVFTRVCLIPDVSNETREVLQADGLFMRSRKNTIQDNVARYLRSSKADHQQRARISMRLTFLR